MPHSITITSTGASAKQANAKAVTASNIVTGGPFTNSACSSSRARNGAMSSYAAANRASEIGSPSIWTRSVIDSKDGLVNSPVVSPCSRNSDSTMRAVLVFPFVPAMWITGAHSCGSPMKSMRAEMRPRSGATLLSGHRASSSASARAKPELVSSVPLMASV